MIIENWKDLSKDLKETYLVQVKEVFFEASSVQNFETSEERIAFYQKWLGLYIDQFPEYFFISRDGESLLGYVIACPDSLSHPELKQPEVGTIHDYESFPVHLHINCHQRSRGKGVGGLLLQVLESFCREKSHKGIHLITKEGERNVGFYLKNGYQEIQSKIVGQSRLLFLGKKLL